MSKKKCPECGGKLEVYCGREAEQWDEDLDNPWYKCRSCGFSVSTEDYNKL